MIYKFNTNLITKASYDTHYIILTSKDTTQAPGS